MDRATGAPANLAEGKPADRGDFLLERRRRICLPLLSPERGDMLDFGCGNGAQTVAFAGQYERIVGLDINPEFVADFQATFAAQGTADGIRPTLYSGTGIPLEDASVDQVVTFTVLEHVPDQLNALSEIHRVLRPGGRLILSVPNKWWVFETHGANLPLLPWNRVPFVSWWPKPLHDRYARARIYRAREIAGLVADTGLEVREVFRMTAPMDMLKWTPLQKLVRSTLFRPDRTRVPFLATEVFVVADKPGG